jgi:uncharacterized phage-associated protein
MKTFSLITTGLSLLATSTPAADTFEKSVQPLLKDFCLTCHSTSKQKGDLDLERFTSIAEIKRDPIVWEHTLDQLVSGEMPPKGKPQLSAEQKTTLVKWVQSTLDQISLASAGDPGPVVLRRLSNMEYTYTVRDLTGVEALDPAKEFPADGAAGEGFTNASAALVMSPSLVTKYLDAAKDIASHAVLTPTGIHFSASNSARDWTDETVAKIRKFYARFSSTGSESQTTQQGIKLDIGTSSGRLPLAGYLAAMNEARTTKASVETIAKAKGLSAKYATTLWTALNDTKPSVLLDPLRAKFSNGTLSFADIEAWQQALWHFASVGHIGKEHGPKAWQEPVAPLAAEHEMRMKLTAPKDGSDVVLYLSTSDAGDGSEHDQAVWTNPRLVAAGRADLPVKSIPAVVKQLEQQRDAVIASTEFCLAAVAEADASKERTDVTALAKKHRVDTALLSNWLTYLGVGTAGDVSLSPLLTKKLLSTPDYSFIQGWTGDNALSVLANSSDQTAKTPGTMKPHSVATHPSPALASVIAWRSPLATSLSIHGSVQDAHTACGNGVTWALELRRGHTREVLSNGATEAAKVFDLGQHKDVRVQPGDVLALIIGPRDGNHICDLTAIDLTISDGTHEWDLANDVSPDILAGNPHADRLGNKDVWHFLSQPEKNQPASTIPRESVLARWRNSTSKEERSTLAKHVWQDPAMRTQLLAFNGPLLAGSLKSLRPSASNDNDISATAPSVTEIRIPASLADGAEFVVTGRLSDKEGSVQMQVLTTKPGKLSGLAASKTETELTKGQWSDNNQRTMHSAPVIVADGSAARKRFEAAFDEFRALFPIALCYTKIVPVDEVVTLTLFHREDDHLKHLMLDDAHAKELDRLWDELRFVSEWPLKQVDVFEQLWQFATQDAKPSAFEPMREPIMRGAEAFKAQQLTAEPTHVQAVLDFAARAWRRPLSETEGHDLRALYQTLRKQDLPHATAVRMMLARVLVAPAFLYRQEKPAPGPKASPVNDWEIATRLSYFLWSSAPDAELTQLAASGKLHAPQTLAAQAQRMMKDERIRRLATEFGCQWLQVRDVATLDEKSERHFPTFVSVRESMQEEVTRFFIDFFQNNRSALSLLDADYTFVNPTLAEHYGMKSESAEWQRVDHVSAHGRGGLLGFAASLAKHAGASRTSGILRGAWLCEVVLGEKLPIPPKGVPVLPEQPPEGLTERQLVEKHSTDKNCAACHNRIDPFGFALEGFDAIGRARQADTKVTLPDGSRVDGLNGLRSYLLDKRRDDFMRQFCRKLLGYALGRSVQLSDKPLINDMMQRLKTNDFKVGEAVDSIVRSPQFREVRGKDFIATN